MMAGLLVSVRSAEEAKAAIAGGASVVDIKEPDRGPLGMASVDTWRAIIEAVPAGIPVSVALGELRDWVPISTNFAGISFRKLGLAGAGQDWRTRWSEIVRIQGGQPRWVAVAYNDWNAAGAPEPSEVLDAALEVSDCSGVLLDTWDKCRPSSIGVTPEWIAWIARVRKSGRTVALAGGLDATDITRLAPLEPDLFAVRGAACDCSDRRGTVRADRVAELVRAIRMGVSGVQGHCRIGRTTGPLEENNEVPAVICTSEGEHP